MAAGQSLPMRSIMVLVALFLLFRENVTTAQLLSDGESMHQAARTPSVTPIVPLDHAGAGQRSHNQSVKHKPIDTAALASTSSPSLLPDDAPLDDFGEAVFSLFDDEDDAQSIKSSWCTDVGLQFELDFHSAFADLRGFGHYFTQRMTKELDSKYTATFRDLSPSQRAADKSFVVFSACSSSNADGVALNASSWLAAFVSSMQHFLDGRGTALHASSDQVHALDGLAVYSVPHDEPVSARIQVWPMAASIAAVSPDSNGVPSIHLSLRVQNLGPLPVRVFQVVCHDVRGFRDTVLPVVPSVVVPQGGDVTLSVDGAIVPSPPGEEDDYDEEDDDFDIADDESKASMRLHVVQSSGEFIDLGVAAIIVPPASKEPAHVSDGDGDTLDALLPAKPAAPEQTRRPTARAAHDEWSSSVRLDDDTQSPAKNDDQNQHEAAVGKVSLRVVGRDPTAEGPAVLPIASFPSSSWKAASMVLMVGVCGYTTFFVYGKLRRRTPTTFKRPSAKAKQASWTRQRREDAADDKECEMMLQGASRRDHIDDVVGDERCLEEPPSPMCDDKPTPPIQLNHAWGRPITTAAPGAASRPPPLQPQPMPPMAPPPPYQLKLDPNVRLHPKRFESLWEESVERKSWTQSAGDSGVVPPTGVVIQVLESQGILCMASGSVAMVDKYLFYSHEVALGQFLFVEIAASPVSLEIASSVRCHRDVAAPAVDALAALVHALIQAMLDSIKARDVAFG